MSPHPLSWLGKADGGGANSKDSINGQLASPFRPQFAHPSNDRMTEASQPHRTALRIQVGRKKFFTKLDSKLGDRKPGDVMGRAPTTGQAPGTPEAHRSL